MVGRLAPSGDGGDERSQLILIGGIAMALIVIGLVLVVNTALFTQVVGSEGTVETTKDAGTAGEELEGSVSTVIHHENVAPTDASGAAVNDTLDDALQRLLVNASVDGGGAIVDVDYRGEKEGGTHVYNGTGTDFTAGGDPSWTLVPDGDVGHFQVVLDVPNSDGSGQPLVVEVTDADDVTETLQIDPDGTDEATFTGPAGTTCTVNATQDTVRADLYRGVVAEERQEGCEFDLFAGRPAPFNVTFDEADHVAGSYSLVTNQSSLPECGQVNVQCDAAIWRYKLQYRYDTVEVSAETRPTREVDVYE